MFLEDWFGAATNVSKKYFFSIFDQTEENSVDALSSNISNYLRNRRDKMLLIVKDLRKN